MSDTKRVTIYTRGVSSQSGTGGYGAVLLHAGHRRELSGSFAHSSNNRMDILAALESLRVLKFPCQVTLYSTNTYLTDAISKGWAARWRADGWRNSERHPTPHADLWEALLGVCAAHEVIFEYHRFDPEDSEYARCDALAHECARRGTADTEELVPVTAELIEAGKSARGGWSRRQLDCLGVSWPPPSGWKVATVGRLIRSKQVQKFLELKAGKEDAVATPDLFKDDHE